MGDTKSAVIFLTVVIIIVLYFHFHYQGGESSAKAKSSEKNSRNKRNTKFKDSKKQTVKERKFKDLCGDESRKVINFDQYVNKDLETTKEL